MQVRQTRLNVQLRLDGPHGHPNLGGSVRQVELDEQMRWTRSSRQAKRAGLS